VVTFFQISQPNFLSIFNIAMCATCPDHFILVDLTTVLIISDKEYKPCSPHSAKKEKLLALLPQQVAKATESVRSEATDEERPIETENDVNNEPRRMMFDMFSRR
jgi:hypothetical protein